MFRSTEYDENYSTFVTSGIARPDWPHDIFIPKQVRYPFVSHTNIGTIASLLRETDVHPPLYFWALGSWRRIAGNGVIADRALSIAFALGALAIWMVVAWRAGVPPLATGTMIALAYGFAYTGHIARGFALAHLFIALASLAALEALRRAGSPRMDGTAQAAGAGLASGLAGFTNYLALFPAAGVLTTMVLMAPSRTSRIRMALAAALPFLLLQIGNLYFFLAQRGTRAGQFEPFALGRMLRLLARGNAANLVGGSPLYVGGAWRTAVGVLLAMLLAAAAIAVALRWRDLGWTRWLWIQGFLAPSLGLFALGAIFDNTPAEFRYVAFAVPFAAVLIAGAAACWARTAPRLAGAGFGLLLAAQAAGALGMMLHPATRQPYRDALAALAPQLGAGTVLLVPFGNDGVGIVGSVLREAPPGQPVLVLRDDDAAAAPRRAADFDRAVLLGIADRDGIRQVKMAAQALRADLAWEDRGAVWRDAQRGFVAEEFERRPHRHPTGPQQAAPDAVNRTGAPEAIDWPAPR